MCAAFQSQPEKKIEYYTHCISYTNRTQLCGASMFERQDGRFSEVAEWAHGLLSLSCGLHPMQLRLRQEMQPPSIIMKVQFH